MDLTFVAWELFPSGWCWKRHPTGHAVTSQSTTLRDALVEMCSDIEMDLSRGARGTSHCCTHSREKRRNAPWVILQEVHMYVGLRDKVQYVFLCHVPSFPSSPGDVRDVRCGCLDSQEPILSGRECWPSTTLQGQTEGTALLDIPLELFHLSAMAALRPPQLQEKRLTSGFMCACLVTEWCTATSNGKSHCKHAVNTLIQHCRNDFVRWKTEAILNVTFLYLHKPWVE